MCCLLCMQVQFLREKFSSLDIEVDGGVSPSTIDTAAQVCVYGCVCACVCVCACMCACVCVCVHVCMCVCMRACVCMSVCTCVCVYECVYMRVCIVYLYTRMPDPLPQKRERSDELCIQAVSSHTVWCSPLMLQYFVT